MFSPALWFRTFERWGSRFALLGVFGLAVGIGAPAHANFLAPPGIPLADLLAGGSFTTSNDLTFSGFALEDGVPSSHKLSFYRVFPLDDGFTLLSPLFGLCGRNAELMLSYEVDAPEGMAVKSASLAVFGGAVKGKSGSSMSVLDEYGDELATLEAIQHGAFGHGGHVDFALFSAPADHLLVDEVVGVKSGLFTTVLGVKQHFHVVSMPEIPEPATALMLCGGLAGLAFARRRRG